MTYGRRTARAAGWLVAAGLATLGQPTAAAGQQALSVESIFGSGDFRGQSISVRWMPDGAHWSTIDRDSLGNGELWRVDARTGEREKLVSAAELVRPGSEQPLDIEGYSFSQDGRRVLIFSESQQVWRARTKGRYYVFDFPTRRLTPVSEADGWQMFAKFSPDARQVAFVRDHDLHVADLSDGSERRLTFDGSETIINGTTDWVYEEELGLRDAFRWSPDGARIAYWRFDQSPVRTYWLMDALPLYPELTGVRYPKAGEENSTVQVGSVELASGETTWFDIGPQTDIYVARMEWAESSEQVVIQRLNRHQNQLDLLLGDARLGTTSLLFSERDEAWIDANDDLHWIEGGERFTWTSDRDGYSHVYLYDRSGRMVRQLTRGNWDVTAFHGVDEEEDRIFFTAASESPTTRSVYRASLEGTDMTRIAGGRGTHSARFSPDFRLFTDTYSAIGSPPVTRLRRVSDGSEVRVLADNSELSGKLEALDLREPEFFTVRAEDGSDLNAWIIKPRDFDPGKTYPLLLYVYGGPGSQTVRDAWGGSRYLWHQMLVQDGILVASVDNRGTGARGREFKKQVYMRLGQLETADQLAALQQLGELPYVDASRVGIWGWSYGGYMALMTSLTGGSRVAAAIAGAPVTSWELYDTIYTERFMRTPQENLDGYAAGAPLTLAGGLEGELLIIHGTADDNVHPQNTLRMIYELEQAGKQFDMRLYPGQRHGVRGRVLTVNLYEMMTAFLHRTLLTSGPGEPPTPDTAWLGR
ncbi:MAG: S9 family peptidase [marine benthic group bacterium]|nr:S9 family peptidase [Candidatus Benthicola marisminoris]